MGSIIVTVTSKKHSSKDLNKSLFDGMSFEQKVQKLVVDDKDQWKIFKELLINKGFITNAGVKIVLVDFVTERENIMRMQERMHAEEKMKQNEDEIKHKKRNLRDSLKTLSNSAKSLKESFRLYR